MALIARTAAARRSTDRGLREVPRPWPDGWPSGYGLDAPPPDAIRAGVEHAMSEAMRRLRILTGPAASLGPLCVEIEAFNRGGKRHRPLLFLLSYLAYGGVWSRPACRAAVAVELLHTFALIHDDILDGSPRRRGGPTVPVRLARAFGRDGDAAALGRDLAILAGDILFALAVETLVSLDAAPERIVGVTRLILGSAVRTGGGVFREIVARSDRSRLTRDELLNLYDAKTGAYSFVCPLQAGAVLAGAPERDLPVLGEFGRHLGRAYQIRDDLDDLHGILQGAEALPVNTAETFLLYPVQTAMRVLPDRDRVALERLCDMAEKSPADRAELGALMRQARAMEEAANEVERILRQAWQTAGRLSARADDVERIVGYCRALLRAG